MAPPDAQRVFDGVPDLDLELVDSRTFDDHIHELTYRPASTRPVEAQGRGADAGDSSPAQRLPGQRIS